MAKKHRNVVSAILHEPWVLTPEKANEICVFLARRSRGESIDPTEIRTEFVIADSMDDEDDGPVIVDGVQVIQLLGTMMPRANLITKFSGGTSTQILAGEILAAVENPSVKTILYEVDSPGGTFTGTPELTAALSRAARRPFRPDTAVPEVSLEVAPGGRRIAVRQAISRELCP